MTTTIRRHILALLLFAAWVAHPRAGYSFAVDNKGEMKFGMRAYTAARIGTNKMGGDDNPLTWPSSGIGHLRQNRYFLQLDFDHDLTRLSQSGWGPPRLFGFFDQGLKALGWDDQMSVKYSVQYRGEGEGIYTYGPSEFSHSANKDRSIRLNTPTVKIPGAIDIKRTIPEELVQERHSRLWRNARQRHRLFLAYLDLEKGPMFVRIGKQVLAWGETDVFRLLDNINPLDDSFGGFFIALDERRVPIEMLRSSYNFGDMWFMHDAFLEGFVATGSKQSVIPGIPPGSPWEPGGIGRPNPQVRTEADVPSDTEVRGGARFVFTTGNVTATLAHYYSYLDVPGVRFVLPGVKTCEGEILPSNTPRFCNRINAVQEFPRVPITGASITFPIESFYSIVRSEAAFFNGEPFNRQGQGNPNDSLALKGTPGYNRLVAENNTEGGLNPFVWPRFIDPTGQRQNKLYGKVLQLNSFQMSLGLDVNRFVRWLNPTQTFFISTQFFYKHVFDSPGDLILPTPFRNIRVGPLTPIVGNPNAPGQLIPGIGGCGPKGKKHACPLQPRFYTLNDDRYLQTLLITTSYSGGRIVPYYGMFYDWAGGLVFQPGVQFVRDPFRFIVDYTALAAVAAGQFGTVRDRDNIRAQVEFVF